MQLANIFVDPVLRRCWLLNKALEKTSLDEALKLAQAAEEFLDVGQLNGQALATVEGFKELRLGGPSAAAPPDQGHRPVSEPSIAPSLGDSASGKSNSLLAPRNVARASETEVIAAASEKPEPAASAMSDRDEHGLEEDRIEAIGDETADPQSLAAMGLDLAVLVSMDDVVRYLRQQDDVVVSAGTDAYLVNGRFRLNFEELLARANKIRQRRGKPQFRRVPWGYPGASGGGEAVRGQDRP